MEDVERLVFFAVRAGAFRAAARQFFDARETFEQAAAINSAKVTALASAIAMAGTAIPAARLRNLDR